MFSIKRKGNETMCLGFFVGWGIGTTCPPLQRCP